MTTDTDVIEKEKVETIIEEPHLYKVILHNDDKTTMDFVIGILMGIFHKSMEEAIHLTMTIHEEGSGVAGIYTKEIAEEKVNETTNYARSHGFPLSISYEEV